MELYVGEWKCGWENGRVPGRIGLQLGELN